MDNQLLWCFFGVVAILLVLDLGIFHRQKRSIPFKESLGYSGFYISLGLLFSLWVWQAMGLDKAGEYLNGFLLEQSLSIDNVFVIAVIFKALHIRTEHQHRILFWGVLGAMVFRGLMITLGAVLIARFSGVLLVFAVFLIWTGYKLCRSGRIFDLKESLIWHWISRYVRICPDPSETRWWLSVRNPVTQKLERYVSLALVALILVEFADVAFALDSIPAIFAVTSDPFIVYTSNIFAILGLRSLYFALASLIERFSYLKYAISLMLVCVGIKIFISHLIAPAKLPNLLSLALILGLLLGGIIFSWYKTSKKASDSSA